MTPCPARTICLIHPNVSASSYTLGNHGIAVLLDRKYRPVKDTASEATPALSEISRATIHPIYC
jgi:hypothetical protein